MDRRIEKAYRVESSQPRSPRAELWNTGRRDEWIEFWRTIVPAGVRTFDPVGTEEKAGFDAATVHAWAGARACCGSRC
ncbi:hypothetical protein ACWFPY_07425 [Nocardia fluminea]